MVSAISKSCEQCVDEGIVPDTGAKSGECPGERSADGLNMSFFSFLQFLLEL